MKTKLAAFAAVVACLLLSACASNTEPKAMTVPPSTAVAPNPALAGALKVGAVTGGQETNPMWTSQVDDASFRQALTESLRNAGYLAAEPEAAPYTLDAALVKLEQPFFGFELDVTSRVDYTLRGKDIERDWPVTAVGTGYMSDSVVAIARLKFANERSIQANIARLLDELRGF